MNKKSCNRAILFSCMMYLWSQQLAAQRDCVLSPPAITIDFGSGNIPDINNRLPKYRHDFTICPRDGFYSYTSHTSNCFNDDWHTFISDHTANPGGNMMLVNASETGGVFFNTTISGLKTNTVYQFAAWMVNVCKLNGGCSPLPPNITIRLLTTAGKQIAEFVTGRLTQNEDPKWKKYFGFFVTPAEPSALILTMEDNTLGGCGNDFALDDITFCECIKPVPVATIEPVQVRKAPVRQPLAATRPQVTKPPVKVSLPKTDTILSGPKKTVTGIPVEALPSLEKKPVTATIPLPILTRENPIVKQIETGAGDMTIDLYDNGEIDGDTVSIYHNNELAVSRAGLSDKPIHLMIKVSGSQPHHELVMVANNLGSIPPNTSLMIITVNNRRYEVHISSSEQKNAKVVIDLKE